MPSFTRGKLKFESTLIKNEEGRIVNMFELSCTPPPTGSETNFNYTTSVRPFVQQRYLQPHEVSALLEGALMPGEIALTSEALMDDIASRLSFNSLEIDTTKIPAAWHQGVDCYKVTVGYVVVYDVYEIKAVCTEDIKVNNVDYPKDDTVASFRIYTPSQYRFIRYFTWNPECCPNKEPVLRAQEITSFYPEKEGYKLQLNPEKWDINPWKFPGKWQDYPNYYYPNEEKKNK